MTAKNKTQILIALTVLIWIAWDIWTYFHNGNPSTESATLYKWSYRVPGVSFLLGLLMGHLFFPQEDVIKEVCNEGIAPKPGYDAKDVYQPESKK